MRKTIFLFALLLAVGCYKTPDDGEYRAVPVTNNPHLRPATQRDTAFFH